MTTSHHRVAECAARIRSEWQPQPAVGIVLGSGLGDLADSIQPAAIFPFDSLPHFPSATAVGHRGRFVCGWLGEVPVVFQQGRVHGYEGLDPELVGMPIRVLQALGVGTLILTNAAGGLRENMQCGDVMLIDDHINLMWMNPLIGPNDDALGPRFPDMSRPYDQELLDVAESSVSMDFSRVSRGVFLAMLGPTYETRAEYRMARQFGADAVGMSTVPEVLVARHCGLRVLAMSAISNVALSDKAGTIDSSGNAVIESAGRALPIVRQIVTSVVAHVGRGREAQPTERE